MFHKGNARPAVSDVEAGWREFPVVADCEALPVPGLKKVLGVRIGTQVMPLDQVLRIRHNADKSETVKIVLPTVQIDADANGNAVLMRNLCSNFGVWQKGETIWIQGEWEEKTQDKPKMGADKAGK